MSAILITLTILLIHSSAYAGNKKTCYSDGGDRFDGDAIILDQKKNLIEFHGGQFLRYFSYEFKDMQTRYRGGGGTSFHYKVTSMNNQNNLDNLYVATTHGQSLRIYKDYHGIKVEVYYAGFSTGKNWWFGNCR